VRLVTPARFSSRRSDAGGRHLFRPLDADVPQFPFWFPGKRPSCPDIELRNPLPNSEKHRPLKILDNESRTGESTFFPISSFLLRGDGLTALDLRSVFVVKPTLNCKFEVFRPCARSNDGGLQVPFPRVNICPPMGILSSPRISVFKSGSAAHDFLPFAIAVPGRRVRLWIGQRGGTVSACTLSKWGRNFRRGLRWRSAGTDQTQKQVAYAGLG
jgi:hypothetical protein